MRITYICQPYPPMISGGALRAQQLAEGMAERGHAVLVIAASDRQDAYTESIGSLKIVRARSFPNPTRVGQRFLLWPQRELRARLHTFCPDIVHLQDPFSAGLCALRVVPALGTPVVFTLHALPRLVATYAPPVLGLRSGVEAVLWRYARWMHKKLEALIVPSHFLASIVYQHTGRRPEVISNGVDLDHFHPQPVFPGESEELTRKYGLDPCLPVILCVGRIDAEKRVDVVVQAAARAMSVEDAQLLVVGDGLLREAMMRLCEELGIRDRTHFPGFVSADGELPGVFRLASVFVTASEIEVQSSTALEAAATGLPIVTVRASSMPEIIEDGVTGYLVPPRDVAGIAERLVSLLQDPDQARAMGKAARALAQGHSLAATMEAHEELYRSLRN